MFEVTPATGRVPSQKAQVGAREPRTGRLGPRVQAGLAPLQRAGEVGQVVPDHRRRQQRDRIRRREAQRRLDLRPRVGGSLRVTQGGSECCGNR